MNSIASKLLEDRIEAGRLLSVKLNEYKNTNAVVIGIPRGGVCVAYAISKALSLPLELMICSKIKHPGNPKKSIGSVSLNDIFIHDCSYDMPQDYIYHQIMALRKAMDNENKFYYGKTSPISFQNEIVILVDDVVLSSDTMMGCIRSIKMEKPNKVIVAVPLLSEEAAKVIRKETDDLQFIKVASSIAAVNEYFNYFPKVDQGMVRDLLNKSKMGIE